MKERGQLVHPEDMGGIMSEGVWEKETGKLRLVESTHKF